ncbi:MULTISPECIES: LytR C-terminal domain-containing protein [unclassified Arthrobacter]|uniref:LytR C-terminal domain-containing protein n=1 Tax=unclassified Arthrobacter TaxID=235627 RepID=UPI001492DCC9|nr:MULTISPECIES: LytR C-terminal domain-containing protein [unclassified Arthrobacter]MBE0010519.1 LytR family transcriptional regulator [Arthrobacter sp. AET 35A]NOJ64328.1 LytR family transcriptional regulator [Arthrobacter sp. 147(2020)]
MSQYPRDEFDKIPESASRQGVHRERLVPPSSSGLALKILVGVLALAVGLAAFFVLPRLGFGSGAEPTSGQSAATATPTGDASSSPTAGTDPSEPVPSEPVSDEPTEEGTAEPTPTADPDGIDRSEPVNVYNATGIGGQATLAADRVTADGWTVGEIADWGGVPLQNSVIFYNDASQLEAAQELGGVLGIPTLIETTEVSPDVTVVVGPGFQ